MGLFSNLKIDKGIASLFGGKTRKEDVLKSKENESGLSVRPSKNELEEEEEENAVSNNQEEETTNVNDSNKLNEKDEENIDLEDDYVRKFARKQGVNTESTEGTDAGAETGDAESNDIEGKEEEDEDEDEEDDDEDEDEADNKEQETQTETRSTPKSSEERARETQEDLEHTIFVKNVPNTVITDRKVFKEFKNLFGPDIKSVRFRSISVAELLPRKVAFIKQKLHPARDAVNSYIVYKSKDRVYEVLNGMNGQEFKDHHLFVDSAAKPREQAANRSVFIGNLQFETSEEQLYRHFAECGEIENLRIIRDRKFNLAKGFAYVQFADISNIQLALLKNDQDFRGRKLRVTRCSKKEQKKPSSASVERSFKQKQTERSRKGNPRKKSKVPEGTVLEGERAKEGANVQFGRKRKNRHENGRQNKPKKARR